MYAKSTKQRPDKSNRTDIVCSSAKKLPFILQGHLFPVESKYFFLKRLSVQIKIMHYYAVKYKQDNKLIEIVNEHKVNDIERFIVFTHNRTIYYTK